MHIINIVQLLKTSKTFVASLFSILSTNDLSKGHHCANVLQPVRLHHGHILSFQEVVCCRHNWRLWSSSKPPKLWKKWRFGEGLACCLRIYESWKNMSARELTVENTVMSIAATESRGLCERWEKRAVVCEIHKIIFREFSIVLPRKTIVRFQFSPSIRSPKVALPQSILSSI